MFNELKQANLINDHTDLQALSALKESGQSIYAYAGFDCTADSLHIGNLVALTMLKRLKQAGIIPLIIIGTATTLVGDPSGKDKARPLLTRELIHQNAQGIKANIRVVLGEDTIFLENHEWLEQLTYIEFLRTIGSRIPLSKLLALDSVTSRLNSNKEGMSVLEFNYSLLQAFDFLTLTQKYGHVIQIGGSDQWGNITMGCELIRRILSKESYAFTLPLLTKSDGTKMGKSVSGAIWLSPAKLAPLEFWQFWRNVDDADVLKFISYFDIENCIDTSEPDINKLKIKLAHTVTTLVHGYEVGEQTTEIALQLASGIKGTATQILVALDEPVTSVILKTKRATTTSDARRLIQGGGVKLDDNLVINPTQKIQKLPATLVLGKKHYYSLISA